MLLYYLFHFSIYFSFYVLFDYILGNKIQGKYYLVHFLNNMYLVYLTFGDVLHTYFHFDKFYYYPVNYESAVLTFALHFYHIFSYYSKLRFDDWLHHILMIFVALPIGLLSGGGSLLGHSLFYLTGLPGGIDYLLLFLVRNNFINALTEKKINNYINLWIRAPGCITHATLTMIGYNMLKNTILVTWVNLISCLFTAILIFWNGIYFMNQVVVNYNSVKNQKS